MKVARSLYPVKKLVSSPKRLAVGVGIFALIFISSPSHAFLIQNANGEVANATLIRKQGKVWLLTVAHALFQNPNVLGFSRPSPTLQYSLIADATQTTGAAPYKLWISGTAENPHRKAQINKKRDLALLELNNNETPIGEPIEEISTKPANLEASPTGTLHGIAPPKPTQPEVKVDETGPLESVSEEILSQMPSDFQARARTLKSLDLSPTVSCSLDGLSGSPVYDDSGQIIGLVSMANTAKGVALITPTQPLSREDLLTRLWTWITKSTKP